MATAKKDTSISITVSSPDKLFKNTTFLVKNWKGDSEQKLTGDTLLNLIIPMIETKGMAVTYMGHILRILSICAFPGMAQPTAEAKEKLIAAVKVSKTQPEQIPEMVQQFIHVLAQHGRYVDTLFCITNSKVSTRLKTLLCSGEDEFSLDNLFSGDHFSSVFSALGELGDKSKSLAEVWQNRSNTSAF